MTLSIPKTNVSSGLTSASVQPAWKTFGILWPPSGFSATSPMTRTPPFRRNRRSPPPKPPTSAAGN